MDENKTDENVILKNAAVGGFDKRSVLDYINSLHAQYGTEIKQKDETISELEKEIKNKADEVSDDYIAQMCDLEKDLAEVSNSFELEKRKVISLEDKNKKLESEIDRLSSENSLLEEKLVDTLELSMTPIQPEVIPEPIEVNQEPPKEIVPEPLPKEPESDKIKVLNDEEIKEYEELVKRKDEFDKASYQLGRVMLDARTDADGIVESAKEQATKLMIETKNIVEKMRAEAEKESQTLIDNAKQNAEDEINAANEEKEVISLEAQKLYDAKIKEANDNVEETLSGAKQKVEKILSASKEVSEKSNNKFIDIENKNVEISDKLNMIVDEITEKTNEINDLIKSIKEDINDTQFELSKTKLAEIAELDSVFEKNNNQVINETDKVEDDDQNEIEITEETIDNFDDSDKDTIDTDDTENSLLSESMIEEES